MVPEEDIVAVLVEGADMTTVGVVTAVDIRAAVLVTVMTAGVAVSCLSCVNFY